MQRVQFFDAKGNVNFKRHELNQRKHAVTRAKYCSSILASGIVEGVRGEPWVCAPSGPGAPFMCITFGTLTESFYDAYTLEPHNAFVVSTAAAGLQCRVFDERTPGDVIRYLRDLHNSYHAGNGVSFIEIIDGILVIESGWADYKDLNGITARGGQYASKYWKYVQDNHPQQFDSYNQFEAAKSSNHYLVKYDLMAVVQEIMGTLCNFEEAMNPHAVVTNIHAVLACLATNFDGFGDMSKDLLRCFMLEAIQMCVAPSPCFFGSWVCCRVLSGSHRAFVFCIGVTCSRELPALLR